MDQNEFDACLNQNGMWEIISGPFYYRKTIEVFLNGAELFMEFNKFSELV